jgi:hypothetical protein
MPVNTSDQQITMPIGADAADNPVAFVNEVADIEPRLVRIYTSIADRTARMLSVSENNVSGLADVNRVEVYDGTNHVSLHTRAVWADLIRTTDSAAINNSTVLVSDAVLVTALPTAGRFHWTCVLYFDAAAAADIKVAYTIPAGATMRWGGHGPSTAVAGNIGTSQFLCVTGSGTTIPYGGSGTGTANTSMIIINGSVVMGGTAGNLQLQYAQNTADPTDLIVRTHSRMTVWRSA